MTLEPWLTEVHAAIGGKWMLLLSLRVKTAENGHSGTDVVVWPMMRFSRILLKIMFLLSGQLWTFNGQESGVIKGGSSQILKGTSPLQILPRLEENRAIWPTSGPLVGIWRHLE